MTYISLVYNNIYFKIKLVKRMALLHVFASFFNILLNRRQLESHTFCIQSIALPHICSLWKTPLHTCKGMRVKRANNSWYYYKSSMTYRSSDMINAMPRVLGNTVLKISKVFPDIWLYSQQTALVFWVPNQNNT